MGVIWSRDVPDLRDCVCRVNRVQQFGGSLTRLVCGCDPEARVFKRFVCPFRSRSVNDLHSFSKCSTPLADCGPLNGARNVTVIFRITNVYLILFFFPRDEKYDVRI